ncbi:hypothetical protein Q3P06_20515 [Ralstonia pseudosolanacearum]|uniref:hypothetical protein n=1 Tax=Ralstonia pseudosolanacearum TaxID=1310165 RepID=UPI002675E7DC|nr:hypothetical protein [Ralstonia pseudosolanacearum]MDO3514287.1 hypothetical protein [Ralstonia pseudosolanacearum]MDO3632064.1 hypothetical protein [Ralstonia pseudosolanacearum]
MESSAEPNVNGVNVPPSTPGSQATVIPTPEMIAIELAAARDMASRAQQSLDVILKIQAQAQTALNEAESKLAAIESASAAVLEVKTRATAAESIFAANFKHVEEAKAHSDSIRAELDRTLVSATKSATEAESSRAATKTSQDTANETLAAISAHKTQADSSMAEISSARETAQKSAGTLKSLADTAETVEKKVAAYEKRLAEFEAKAAAQLTTIVGLLPGATSAGLAHAFNERGKLFQNPGKRWQWLFIASVVTLACVAASGLWQVVVAAHPLDFSELLRLWLARLPFAAALIWLALHSSREAALAKRLEEDYGYKAAIAASFQGFQKQMAEIGANAGTGSALAKLCDDTLATIASPPGRIYDKHKLTVSPGSEVANFVKALKDVVGDVTKKAGP